MIDDKTRAEVRRLFFAEHWRVGTISAQLGLHHKPSGLLNVAGYFDPLLAFFDHALAERFLRPEHRAMVLVDSNADRLLDRLQEFRPPDLDKWIQPDET